MDAHTRKINVTKNLAVTAVIAAVLTALKQALAFIPNVEAVTVCILVFAAVFGGTRTALAAGVFCALQIAFYGFNTWVPLYFIYYPSLAALSSLAFFVLRTRSTATNAVAATAIAVVATAAFGVLSTGIDVGFAYLNGASVSSLYRLFAVYYTRGSYFYIIHVVSNAIVTTLLFTPLFRTLNAVKSRIFIGC